MEKHHCEKHRKSCHHDGHKHIGGHKKNQVKNHKKDCRKYDAQYIIIGAGTAGTLLAKNLAQSDRGNKHVLLFEAGEFVNDDPLYIQPFSPTVSLSLIHI